MFYTNLAIKKQKLVIYALTLVLTFVAFIFVPYLKYVQHANSVTLKPAGGQIVVKAYTTSDVEVSKPFTLTFNVKPNKHPLTHIFIKIDYDPNYVNILDFNVSDTTRLKVYKQANSFYIQNANTPTVFNLQEVLQTLPQLESTALSVLDVKINAILKQPIANNQRPIRISYVIGQADTNILYYVKNTMLPEIQLGTFVSNNPPTIISSPNTVAIKGQEYVYEIKAIDKDKDQLTYSLKCPNFLYCALPQFKKVPSDIALMGNKLVWDVPKDFNENTLPLRIYISDGKSVSEQSFLIRVFNESDVIRNCTLKSVGQVRAGRNKFVLNVDSILKIKSVQIIAESKNDVNDVIKTAVDMGNNKYNLFTDNIFINLKQGVYNIYAEIITENQQVFYCPLSTGDSRDTLRNNNKTSAFFFIKKVFAQSPSASSATTTKPNSYVVVTENNPPIIIANSISQPAVGTKTSYTYYFRAEDPDGDALNYVIVTKPKWISVVNLTPADVTGLLELKFTGVPTKSGAYTFSVSVTDGKEWKTKTWLLSVVDGSNTPPQVELIEPVKDLNIKQGDILNLKWQAQDKDGISTTKIYYTDDPIEITSYKLIDTLIGDVNTYKLNTSKIPRGRYYLVLEVTDSSNNKLVTRVISPLITVGLTNKSIVKNQDPFIKLYLMSPETNKVEIDPLRFEFIAQIQASKGAVLDTSKIRFLVDGKDLTKDVEFSRPKGDTITILYKPEIIYSPGTHLIQIVAVDSNDKSLYYNIDVTIKDTNQVNIEESDKKSSVFGITLTKTQKNVLIIISVAFIVAILLPFVLYLASSSSTVTLKESPDLPVSTPQKEIKSVKKHVNKHTHNTTNVKKHSNSRKSGVSVSASSRIARIKDNEVSVKVVQKNKEKEVKPGSTVNIN